MWQFYKRYFGGSELGTQEPSFSVENQSGWAGEGANTRAFTGISYRSLSPFPRDPHADPRNPVPRDRSSLDRHPVYHMLVTSALTPGVTFSFSSQNVPATALSQVKPGFLPLATPLSRSHSYSHTCLHTQPCPCKKASPLKLLPFG